MKTLFDDPTDKDLAIMAERNNLIDQQERLKIHHYRTANTILTADDKKHDELQIKIDELNKRLGY